jgi:hypothetical protein
VSFRVWRAGEHELVETVLRERRKPQDALTLEEPGGGSRRWTVVRVEKDPHGWRTTAARCLPGCTEHLGSEGPHGTA